MGQTIGICVNNTLEVTFTLLHDTYCFQKNSAVL